MRLLQQPKTGIDFDQALEPSNPRTGQVWREQLTGVFRDWRWSGSRWVSTEERRHPLDGVIRVMSGSSRLRLGNRFDLLIDRVDGYGFIPADFSGSSYGRIIIRQTTAANGGVNFLGGNLFDTRDYVSGQYQSLEKQRGYLISTAPPADTSNTVTGIDFTYSVVSTPSNLPDGVTLIMIWRQVRR